MRKTIAIFQLDIVVAFDISSDVKFTALIMGQVQHCLTYYLFCGLVFREDAAAGVFLHLRGQVVFYLQVLAATAGLQSAGHFVAEGLNLIQDTLFAAERGFDAFLFFFNCML